MTTRSTVLILGVCIGACSNPSGIPDMGGLRMAGASASWPEHYSSISDLKRASDLAVWASVSKVEPAVPADWKLPTNINTIAVRQVLWLRDSTDTAPESLTFKQNPGTIEDPTVHEGDELIVFLTEYEPRAYRVTGGPQGRFNVDNGRIQPVAPVFVQLAPDVDLPAFQALLDGAEP